MSAVEFAKVQLEAARGIEEGLHLGVQAYASQAGRCALDLAVGRARPDQPLRTDTIMPWFSAAKPLTALCLGRLHDAGRLDLDAAVSRYVPEFLAGQPEQPAVRVAHLLAHTVAFQGELSPLEASGPWADAVAAACRAPLRPGATPGDVAAYSLMLTWQVLAEVVQRVSGDNFADHVRRHIFEPLDMTDCYFGISDEDLVALRDRIAEMYDTSGDEPQLMAWVNEDRFLTATVPGLGGRGPMRRLARVYEALVGLHGGPQALGLSPTTAGRLTTTCRVGRFDPMYGGSVRWGLGFLTDRRLFAGPRTSRASFGHDGFRCVLTFADPERQLVFCAAANGLPKEAAHRRRFRVMVDALLDEIGMAVG
jgi:CubicO group peptidase (beta-lactamase class C family)